MARYRLLIKPSATKEIEAIEPITVRRKVVQRIQALAENPRPPGNEKLSAQAGRYRVRQGVWRIVYAVQDDALIVLVVKVAHRSEVYRRKK